MSLDILQMKRRKATLVTFLIVFLALIFSSGETYTEILFTGVYGGAIIAGLVYILFSIFTYFYFLIRR